MSASPRTSIRQSASGEGVGEASASPRESGIPSRNRGRCLPLHATPTAILGWNGMNHSKQTRKATRRPGARVLTHPRRVPIMQTGTSEPAEAKFANQGPDSRETLGGSRHLRESEHVPARRSSRLHLRAGSSQERDQMRVLKRGKSLPSSTITSNTPFPGISAEAPRIGGNGTGFAMAKLVTRVAHAIRAAGFCIFFTRAVFQHEWD